MKGLMFGWEFPPQIQGGLGIACYHLVEALSAYVDHISFIVPYGKNKDVFSNVSLLSVQEEVMTGNKGIQWMPVTAYGERVLLSDISEKNLFLDALTGERNQKRKVAQILDQVNWYASFASSVAESVDHDFIHIHDWLTVKAGILAQSISGKPILMHIHSLEFDRSGEHPDPTIFQIEKLGMEKSVHIFAVSEYTKRIIIEKYHVSPGKVSVVYNAVPGYFQKITKPRSVVTHRVVTFVGRITFQKGPDYFVEAAKKVLSKDPHVQFVMAGDGDMLPQMIEQVSSARLSHRFHFTGFLNQDEVQKLLRESSVFVMPSVSEPFGIAPLEAVSLGVPVIVSKNAGVSEVISSMLRVDFWDIDELANMILSVLNYRVLSEVLTQDSTQQIGRMSWDSSAKIIAEKYRISVT